MAFGSVQAGRVQTGTKDSSVMFSRYTGHLAAMAVAVSLKLGRDRLTAWYGPAITTKAGASRLRHLWASWEH